MANPLRALILGAGASRGVSYAEQGNAPSPLDADFYDLLRRHDAGKQRTDHRAIARLLNALGAEPPDCQRSLERGFYTLHLRAHLRERLDVSPIRGLPKDRSSGQVERDFALSLQALLRAAHKRNQCEHHKKLLSALSFGDAVISFNYDLVVERAIKTRAEEQGVEFGPWVYGFDTNLNELPTLHKLHGSCNWKIQGQRFVTLTKDWKDLATAPGYKGLYSKDGVFPIMLPYWDKKIDEEPWRSIWQRAVGVLGDASEIIVWGFSLSPTDVKAQQLFRLGFANRDVRLCVIDPSAATVDRWRAIAPSARLWHYPSFADFERNPPRWLRLAHSVGR